MAGGPSPAERRPPPLGRWGASAYRWLGFLAGLILALMTLAVFAQVVFRFVGWAGIDGLDEVPRYLFVWLVMIGAAAAMQRAEHTRLEYFHQRMGPRGQALTTVVVNGVGMLLFLSLVRTSLVLVPNSQLQTSAGLGLPLGYVFAAVPVGSVLILLPMAWNLVVALGDLWRKPS
jgi:TRAP-type C4-dicarboxylate transport system permease small subunit